jgi:hypothetical protein
MRRALVLLALVACRSHDEAPASHRSAPAPLVHATQADLAHELDLADRQGTWTELRRRWQGQALRWTVTRYRTLCGAADSCFVAAFPIARPAKHGWMPKLELSQAEMAKLDAKCPSAMCSFAFEGTLAELTASPDEPTSLTFADVHVL